MVQKANLLLRLVFIVLVLGGIDFAQAAPVRVLPPASNSKLPRAQLVVEFLTERLGECGGIDMVRGGRAGIVSSWLHSGAFDLTEEESWKRLQSYVAIDALVFIDAEAEKGTADKPGATIQIRVYRKSGIETIKAAVPDAAGPEEMKAVLALGERVGRALGLDDSDIRAMSEARFENPGMFHLNYTTHTPIGSWITHPYTYAFLAVSYTRFDKPPLEFDAIAVRVLGDYIGAVNATRGTDKLQQAQSMVLPPLLRLLGTAKEHAANGLLSLPRNTYTEPVLTSVENVLLQIAQPLVAAGSSGNAGVSDAELDELGAVTPADKTALHDSLAKPTELSAIAGQSEFSLTQRLSALRMLGVMGTTKSAMLLQRAAASSDKHVRQVVADALSAFTDDATLSTLNKLASDPDEVVAFSAACSLTSRKQGAPDIRKRLIVALQTGEPTHTRAALALACDPTLDDDKLLQQLAADKSQSVRAAMRATRSKRIGAVTPLTDVVSDTDSNAIIKAIRAIAPDSLKTGAGNYDRLVRLANDPDIAVAQAAREALIPLRPTDTEALAHFNLAVALPYTRQKTVALLAASPEPWARAELVSASENPDAHTRVAALRALAKLDPAVARGLLLTALSDAHLYVRFHAAALLAPLADASQSKAIEAAIPLQRDHATALYLEDALARATGKPPPLPRPAANSVNGPDTIPWLWGPLTGDADSPYGMHYKPSHGNHVRDDPISDLAKSMHAAGMAYFYNIGPLGESGVNLVDPAAQDRNWIYLDDQLDTEALPFIDGIDLVNGGLDPDALWPSGWHLFCDELGIDSTRVAGNKKNLGAYEAQAWTEWAKRLCIAARNQLYDYVKLKFGRLHPGLQVSTAIDDNLDAAGFDWKFDVSTVHNGSGRDSRKSAYAAVRRAKTMWPDRPVFWLVEGLNVPNLAIMKYDFKMPTAPLISRSYSAYGDALAAWMAGADPGWGCIWAVRTWDWADPNFSAMIVSPEDIKFNSKQVHEAVDYAFAGAEPAIRERDAKKIADAKGPALPAGEKEKQMDGMLEAITDPDASNMTKRIEKEKAAMYLGFQFYGKHLLDIAKLFASLPRNQNRSNSLLIGALDPSGEGSVIDSPGADLVGSFDAINDINEVSRVDLRNYRFIAVSDPAALTDETIATVTKWLKETPSVLYVHRDLTGDNRRQAGTPEAFDGELKLDWPWEKDISIADSAAKIGSLKLTSKDGQTVAVPEARLTRVMKITGESANAELTSGINPALIVWRDADFHGAVVFDAVEGGGHVYREALRRVLNDLHTNAGVGEELAAAERHETFSSDRWTAEVTDGTEPRVVSGVDLLTGELNPLVGPGKSAAFVGRDFQGKYAAAYNGVSVLCDRPIAKIEKIEGGLRIECDGLIQAASTTGGLLVKAVGGAQPPAVSEEKRVNWVMLENSPGIATQAIGDGKNSQPAKLFYVRCKGAVDILVR